MNFCINCKFFQEASAGAEYAHCLRAARVRTSPVTGQETREYPYCDLERKYQNDESADGNRLRCGPEALYFQAKEAAA